MTRQTVLPVLSARAVNLPDGQHADRGHGRRTVVPLCTFRRMVIGRPRLPWRQSSRQASGLSREADQKEKAKTNNEVQTVTPTKGLENETAKLVRGNGITSLTELKAVEN